jgi:hypothetical protein
MFRARGPKEAGTLQERVAAAAAQLADKTLLPGEEAEAETGEGRLGLHLAPSGVRQSASQTTALALLGNRLLRHCNRQLKRPFPTRPLRAACARSSRVHCSYFLIARRQ